MWGKYVTKLSGVAEKACKGRVPAEGEDPWRQRRNRPECQSATGETREAASRIDYRTAGLYISLSH